MNPIDSSTLQDFAEHLARLRALAYEPDIALRQLFVEGTPIHVARAPGRLDVMGGIGDYSGSLVLEMPIAEAAFAAMQRVPDGGVIIVSLPQSETDAVRSVNVAGDEWEKLRSGDYETAQRFLQENVTKAWAAYVLGPIIVLLQETNADLDSGLRVLIDSRVPEGKGVSSSAAVEVATMRAAAALCGQQLAGKDVARYCQIAENRVVGAPCGIMDQMTSAVGRRDELLALLCQPAIVERCAAIPAGIAFWGIDSGIRHAVSGSDYTSVRTGTFMGYRLIADAAGLSAKRATGSPGVVEIDDPRWHGYLANVTPAEFQEQFAAVVPSRMTGRDFLARFGGTTDTVTRVDPARTYEVREPTLHPIGENVRAHRFRELLAAPLTEDSLRELGQLMYAAHDSYTACGLASDGTDLLVEMVRDRGPESGLFGAKITGGGSGGTVAILGRIEAHGLIDELAVNYRRRSGREPYIFRGSSPGACATEVAEVII